MRKLRRLLAIRPDEARLVGRLAALFATVEAARGVGEIGADTLILGQLGAGALPYLYVALGLLSLIGALGFSVAVGRLRRRPLFVATIATPAVILLVERLALVGGSSAVLQVMWLTVYVAGALIGTLVWVLAGWILDARQAKRLFPLCSSAAILGGFVGMISAGPLARLGGAENLLLVQAGLLVAAATLTASVSRAGRTTPARQAGSISAELRVGFDYVRRSPLMRLVAVAYVLFAILSFSVSYPFLSAMTAAFPAEADLATALGLVSAAITAASFIAAVLFANRLYSRFGIATVALALPLVYVAGFGVWLVRFSLATAMAFRFVQQVTQRGLSNAAWSAFYNVVPGERRAQVLSFMDGVPGQIGITLAGLLLLMAGDLLSQSATFVLGIGAAVVSTWVVVRIRRAYSTSLLTTLRDGLTEQLLEGGPGLLSLAADPKVIETLEAGLHESNPGVRRLSADLLGRLGATGATVGLTTALDDPEPIVRSASIRALIRLGQPIPSADLDRLRGDPSPLVRAEVAVALLDAGDEGACRTILDGLLEGRTGIERSAGLNALARLGGAIPTDAAVDALADPSAEVRAAAIEAVAADAATPRDPVPILTGALDDEAGTVRAAAARTLAGYGDPARSPTLAVLEHGTERAQEAALTALEGHGDDVRSELVAWSLGQVERAATLRRRTRALTGTGEASGALGTIAFLASVLDGQRARIEERLAHALAILGAPDDAALIGRSLRSDESETRALAIEALDTLRDRRLSRAVVGLLESEPDDSESDTVETLTSLVDDPDAWVRILAARALAERGSTMPTTTATLDEIGRMLVLRRVPLFGGLAAEDLQRIAASAVEHVYPAGEALVTEGDLGDELVVIVEGTVRVMRADGELIRSYGPGDHIGELAVLRERPRAATVVADAPGVRGLIISGVGLKAILRERPEAAMAMLATLAERLGTA